MKKHIWVGLAAVIVLICVSIASKAFYDKSQQYKDFTSHIDLLMEAYRSAKSATDPDDKRRSVNMVSGCLMQISEAYQDSDNPERLSSYLTENTPRRIIEDIYSFLQEYNEEHPDHPVQVPDDALRFYD